MPVATFENIPTGFRGTEATIKRMHQLASKGTTDLTIQKIADAVISKSGCADRNYDCKAEAIYNFVKGYVRFERDPFGVEMVQEPIVTLKRRAGDCIPLDQKVIVRHRASNRYELKPAGDLADVFVEYDALSYSKKAGRFEFAPITQFVSKGRKPVIRVRTSSGQVFRATSDHRVGCVLRKNLPFMGSRRYGYNLSFEKLEEAVSFSKTKTAGIAMAHKIPAIHSVNTVPAYQLYVEGLHVAEGYSEAPYKVEISNRSTDVITKLTSCLDLLRVPYRVRRRKDGLTLVNLRASYLSRRLHGLFGEKAQDKQFPSEYLSLSQDDISILVSSYSDGDGYIPKRGAWKDKVHVIYNTASEALVEQLTFLHLVLGKPLSLHYQKSSGGAGKEPLPMWRGIHWKKERSYVKAHIERLPNIENSTFKVKDDGEAEVCDFSVAGNRNFVTSAGHVLHNCDDHSILIASLASAVGFPYAFKTIKADMSRADEFSHIYAVVNVKGRGWVGMDTSVTTSYYGWEPPGDFASQLWFPKIR